MAVGALGTHPRLLICAPRFAQRGTFAEKKEVIRATQSRGGGDACARRVQEEVARICISLRVNGMLRKSATPDIHK